MLELGALRKNKINLADYNSQHDIENRILLSDFSPFDLSVLEEILFSPLKISLKKLARNLNVEDQEILPILTKLSKSGLLAVESDSIVVDKEMRKYFEFQIQRFDPEFKPDLEFLQGLLRKVPIHVLPTWYSIPRSSNNIFESIIEKHLLTPHIFQRYLNDLHFADPSIAGIIKDLYATPDFTLSSSDAITKYNLTRRDFEEIMLLLEYNFVCTVRYVKEDEHWHEIITPFYEWHQYLRFLRETDAPIIELSDLVQRKRDRDFAFIEDMTSVLQLLQKKPVLLDSAMPAAFATACHIPLETVEDFNFVKQYFTHLVDKLCLLKLAAQVDSRLYALETANDWLDLSLENRSLFLYRHQMNRILSYPIASDVGIERNLREAEKSIRRVLHGGWVLFDDFIKGAIVPLNEDSVAILKKSGKHWKYTLPSYSEAEKDLIKASIFELLFESGIVAVGTLEGRDCFRVTAFGRFFFEE